MIHIISCMPCSGGVHSSIYQIKPRQHSTMQCSPPSLQYIYVCTRHNKTRVLNKSRNDGNHGATGNTLLIRVLWLVKPVPLVKKLIDYSMNACVTVPLWTLDETPSSQPSLILIDKKKQQQGKADVQGGPSAPPSLPSANPR